MRTLVVGDIHGALKSLQDVLIKSKYNPDEDRIIFLGDYVDGWGESSEVIDFLIGIDNKANFNKARTDNAIFIMGNHDIWCKDYLTYGRTPHNWISNGGGSTINSYVKTDLVIEESHRKFFANLVDWYIDKDNNIFIHGGWAYREDEFPVSAKYPVNAGVGAKECHWDRTLLAGARSGHRSKMGLNALKPFNKVFIGHTATLSHLPEKYCNLWNIDSGCGWHGKLTIMDIDTEEYWQSDFTKNHYPDYEHVR